MPDQLDEGRHSWDPGHHPRDGDGQFATSGGGGSSSGRDGSGDGSRAARGMPSALSSSRVSLTNGGSLSLVRRTDGGLDLDDGHRSTSLNKRQADQLLSTLDLADDWESGDSESLDGVGSISKNGRQYTLALDDGPTVTLTRRDITRMGAATEQLDKASRVDTGNGDADVFTDGKKVGFRMLGDDGRPVEAVFNRGSFDKVNRAIDLLVDEIDFPDNPAKPVTRKDVTTNLGKVRVEMFGKWGSDGRLEIEADDGSWGIVVDGPQKQDWSDALSRVEESHVSLSSGWGEQQPMHMLSEHVSLSEAAGGAAPKGRRFRARLIAGDIQGSSGYYSAAMLKKHAGVFREGLPVFLDHPGVTDAYERPERSVRDLAGRLASPAVYERDGLYADVEVYEHWAPVIEAMAHHIGMSIRASGTVEASTNESIRGPIVTSLTEAASVDFVTAAGAGGKIVALLESARAQAGEHLRRAAEAHVIPKGEAEKTEEHLSESRNVAAWLESRIHLAFTQLTDDMYGDGRLTRDERIALSSAIGDGLAAFSSRVEADMPHLYQRDLWDSPELASAEVVETSAPTVPAPPATTLEESRMSGTNPQGAPEGGASTETEVTEAVTASARAAVAEAERDQYRASAQALTEAQQAQARAIAERDAAISESRRLVANDSARNAVSRLIAESGLSGAVASLVGPRVTNAVLDRVPLTESGQPNTQALDAAVKAAIEAERTYAAALMEAHGVGDVRGLGGSTEGETLSESDFNAALESVFTGVGLGADVAKAAAKGRMNF